MTQQQTHIVGEQEYGAYVSGEEERQISDEMIAIAKARVGEEHPPSRRDGWNTEASHDAIRHYAEAHGMDNPLFFDPKYAQHTRWRGIIAPPTFLKQSMWPRRNGSGLPKSVSIGGTRSRACTLGTPEPITSTSSPFA